MIFSGRGSGLYIRKQHQDRPSPKSILSSFCCESARIELLRSISIISEFIGGEIQGAFLFGLEKRHGNFEMNPSGPISQPLPAQVERRVGCGS